jgi:phenylalanyl-tRNA synthetase beta chain
VVPSHRSDIDQLNDLAEEVTRMIGYDNIASKALALPVKAKKIETNFEDLCRSYLINNGFFEVVNFPFNDNQDEAAISVDNPLDKQRSKMRVCITKSLKENVVFNQNRQKDSIKFFEFSDIYTKDGNENKLAVIVSGRTNKNFKEFNAQLDYSYLKGLIKTIFSEILGKELNFELDQSKNYDLYEKVYCDDVHIGRIGKLSKEFVGSKTKTPVFSFEIVLNNLQLPAKKQTKISDFPASYRDLSFSLDSHDNLGELSALIEKHKELSELMTDCFVFDLFENKKQNILKVGYRFKFQAIGNNITDEETEAVMNPLIKESLQINGINIEGL